MAKQLDKKILDQIELITPPAKKELKFILPVLEVWKAETCIVLKRSMATGYAGVDNPLFLRDNTRMLFGDAKDSLDSVLKELR